MKTREILHSDLAIPPGEYLAEVLSELGVTRSELARIMNRPLDSLNAIFDGDEAITSDTAKQLEKVVKVPAHIWLGLEVGYQLALARNYDDRES